jgi:hypothetical protein
VRATTGGVEPRRGPVRPGRGRGSKGVFLSPLSPGTPTITIRGGAWGDLVEETLGITHLREDFTYTVNVVRGRL